MTIGGLDPSSGNTPIPATAGTDIRQKLEEANKTVLDAGAKGTNEDDYQEFVGSDDAASEKNTKTSDNSVKNNDDKVRQYYEQLQNLRDQLDDISNQKRALIAQMQAGTDTSQIMTSLTSLNNQANNISNNITLIFSNIMQLEANLENQRLAQAQSALNASSQVNGTTSTSQTTPVATQTLDNNAKISTQTGKLLAEAVVASINANGSTKGWCLRGVNRAMSKVFGYGFAYASAYQALGALQADSNFVEITSQYPNPSDLKKLPAGAIVVWGNNSAHPHGHISIALGDGREASDHIANQYTNSGNGYHIFMPKEKS